MGNDEQNLSKDGINVTEADVKHCRQERLERRIRFKNNHLKNFQESSTHTHTGTAFTVTHAVPPAMPFSTNCTAFRIFLQCTDWPVRQQEWYYIQHTHTRLTALFRDYPGKPVPER